MTLWPRVSTSRHDVGHRAEGNKNIFVCNRLLAQNCEAVLAVIDKLAGDNIFAKVCLGP